MSDSSLVFVIPTYAMGSSVRPTLVSINEAVSAWSSDPYALVLSDSSPNGGPVAETELWAAEVGCELIVEHSNIRRIQKEALNVAFSCPEVATADIVIVTTDDVLLDTLSVLHLVHALATHPEAAIAVGSTRPDPLHSTGARRAGAWQLQVVAEIARRVPAKSVRSEGALWATRGKFAREFRYPIGHGSIVDDVALTEHVSRNGFVALNVHQAIAYKVPPLGFAEFSAQTRRSQISLADSTHALRVSLSAKSRAITVATLRNPAGAFKYVLYRLGMLAGVGHSTTSPDEQWTRQQSTLR